MANDRMETEPKPNDRTIDITVAEGFNPAASAMHGLESRYLADAGGQNEIGVRTEERQMTERSVAKIGEQASSTREL